MRAGRGFRVVLNAENRFVLHSHAFTCVVTQVDMSSDDFAGIQAFTFHTKPMVLAGDFNLLGQGIEDRLVGPPMSELELVGLAAQGQSQNLVAQAYAEDGNI